MRDQIEDLKTRERKLFVLFCKKKETLKQKLTDENCRSFCEAFLLLTKVKEQISEIELLIFREENEN